MDHLEVECVLKKRELYDALLHKHYNGVVGILTTLLGLLLLAGYLKNRSILFAVLGIVIIVALPVCVYWKAGNQLNHSKEVHYIFECREQGIVISEKGAKSDYSWELVKKVVSTSRSVLIYLENGKQIVVPRKNLGVKFAQLFIMMTSNLKPNKIRIRQ